VFLDSVCDSITMANITGSMADSGRVIQLTAKREREKEDLEKRRKQIIESTEAGLLGGRIFNLFVLQFQNSATSLQLTMMRSKLHSRRLLLVWLHWKR
jgi:hypothetical protein